MKKIAAFILSVWMLFGCAAKGEIQLDFTWRVGLEGLDDQGKAVVTSTEEGLLLVSEWLNNNAILFEEIDIADLEGVNLIPQLPEGTGKALSEIIGNWTASHQGVTRTGFFSGDAFESAEEETTYEISWADVYALISTIRREVEDDTLAEILENAEEWTREAAMSSETRMILRDYDGGKADSLTVMRGTDTVNTLSIARSSDSGFVFRFVWGWAEGGKDYYTLLDADMKDPDNVQLHGEILADDECRGFRSLGRSALICSWDGILLSKDRGLSFETMLTPANGTGPFFVNGSVLNATARLEMAIGTQENTFFEIVCENKAEIDHTVTEGKNVIRFFEMSEEEETALSALISGKGITMLYKLIQVLPEQVLMVMLNGVP